MPSSLKFGTSGLRGLAVDLSGAEARRYVRAFLDVLLARGEQVPALYLGADLRDSSPQIVADCAAAAAEMGIKAISCGALPTPALALHAMQAGAPAIMVTGSHIPADRNGLKFYTRLGEIDKADESAISAALKSSTPGEYGAPVIDEATVARRRYLDRYARFLPPHALKGLRIGVYEHSSVARDLLAEIFSAFGAEIIRLGRVSHFVAVDTEAFSDPVFVALPGWIVEHGLDAIVSTDGDADRPLLMDDRGAFMRGDVLGLLAAALVQADCVVTPVTSNSALEATGFFKDVLRTRVGSPHVIAAMQEASRNGSRCVVGFEANGGTLLGSDVSSPGPLARLSTRDAVLPLLGVFAMAARQAQPVSALVQALPLRASLSGRLENVPANASHDFLQSLATEPYAANFFSPARITDRATIDGLQFWLDNGTMIHYRASGNAPELRCYIEAPDAETAKASLEWGLAAAARALED